MTSSKKLHQLWYLNVQCIFFCYNRITCLINVFCHLFSDTDCYNSSSPYTGKMTCTVSGRTCQNWNSQYPHMHDYILHPDDQNSTYCRNPDGQTGVPWCLTTDPAVRYEYCWVSKCENI